MAIPTDRDLIQLGPWRQGANNLAEETSVPRGSFREGVNVDVADSGKVRRRRGYTKVADADEPESLFGYGNRGFFLEGGSLMGFEVIDGVETAPTELYAGLRPFSRLAHCLIDPDIYVSDGDVSLRVSPSNAVSLWSVPATALLALTSSAGGTLPEGRYGVSVALKTASGEEGPLTPMLFTDAAEGSSLNIAVQPAPAGLRTAVYMTKPNGTALLLLAVLPSGVGVAALNKQALGRAPVSEDLDMFPGGAHALVWNGRLVNASGRYVQWSEPFQFGLWNPGLNYRELIEDVTMLAAAETQTGFFIGQKSRTYYMSGGDPADASLKEAYPAGVIPGTLQMVPGERLPLENPPADPTPMWLSTTGVFCVGLGDGTVIPLTAPRFATQIGPEGAALFDPRRGINRFVATVRNPSDNVFAMSDSFTAEVVRNNIDP